MPREIAVFDTIWPGALVILLLAILLFGVVDWVLGHWGGYDWVWHPALFRLALLLGLFAGLGLILF